MSTSFARRTTAIATAVAVSAVALPSIATAQTTEVAGGEFSWGIKASFLGYIASSGKITAAEGAEYTEGQFVFPVDGDDSDLDASGDGTIALDGTAHVQAHEGKGANGGYGLDAKYSDLELKIDGTTAELIGDYVVTGAAGEDGEAVNRSGDDEVIATITLPAAITAGTNYEQSGTTVADAGMAGSLGYEAGTELDAADLSVEFGEDAGSENPGEETPSEGSSDAGLIAAVIAIIAAIGGVVAALGGLIPGLTLPF